jgi:hypothetical protein
MKTICAWCKKHMDGDPADDVVSHGICKPCADKMRASPGWRIDTSEGKGDAEEPRDDVSGDL